MGKIRVKTLGDEAFEKEQADEAKKRRDAKALKKGKTHVKGVGLKGGQQISVMEGVELKPEVEALLQGTPTDSVKGKKTTSKKIKSSSRSRRYKELLGMVDRNKSYPIKEAIDLLKRTSNTKFAGTVEIHININPATLPKEKTNLSGTVNLPHGTGKQRKIVIADDTVLVQIAHGKLDFDILVAHPSMMPKLAKFARVLGPKGLMPNPKNGTVSPDPEKKAKELAGGETSWKTQPDQPLIHMPLGKVSFSDQQIQENLEALIKSVGIHRITKLVLNSTMGPGIKVDVNSI